MDFLFRVREVLEENIQKRGFRLLPQSWTTPAFSRAVVLGSSYRTLSHLCYLNLQTFLPYYYTCIAMRMLYFSAVL